MNTAEYIANRIAEKSDIATAHRQRAENTEVYSAEDRLVHAILAVEVRLTQLVILRSAEVLRVETMSGP